MNRAPQAASRGGPSLRGAIICAAFNAFLGVLLGFFALAATPVKDYKPIPDPKTGKPPPFPNGVWYWPGGGSGDWRGKEPQFLADKPGEVVITEGDFNSWALANMKGASPIVKTAKKPAAKAPPKPAAPAAGQKKDAVPPANTAPSFEFAKGTPNFHIFKDPLAPAADALSFQMAMPFNVTILGVSETVVLQVRGVFVPGANGPQLQSYYCTLGSARIPAFLSQTFINAVSGAMSKTEDGKKYVAAWAKYGSATLHEGELVLAAK